VEAPAGPGLAAAFSLNSQSSELLVGAVSYPLLFTLAPLAFQSIDEGEMDIRVDSDALPLADFDDILPPDVGLDGTCTVAIHAKGPTENPTLEGRLVADNFNISLENGTRVTSSGAVQFSGTRKRPSVTGEFEIHNGVIRIPEKKKDLHPVSGNAVLWEREDPSPPGHDDAEAPESVGGEPPAAGHDEAPHGAVNPPAGSADEAANSAVKPPAGSTDEPASGTEEPASSAVKPPAGGTDEPASGSERVSTGGATQQDRDVDLDVTVTIPSGLWIRGQGMDVELAGDLRLIQKGTYPAVSGELQAIGGRLVFLGRTFHVDRGSVVFYGGDEIDPSMDLVLSTNVEGTTIRILLGGTTHEPELNLTSEPEFPEGDIMSLLVFGRTMDELDNEQMNLLGRRAADMAAAFGAAQLETRLSQQLGVDLVTIGRSSGQEGGTSLVIGKYLSPKVLLKYEQALEERARFFVNLEYFLSRHFKIETLIGHQSQSAVEFNWTREY
jgi:autotransporter translocation and assembly factor TamB